MSHMHVPLAHAPEFTNSSKRSERQVFGDTLVEGEDLGLHQLREAGEVAGMRCLG